MSASLLAGGTAPLAAGTAPQGRSGAPPAGIGAPSTSDTASIAAHCATGIGAPPTSDTASIAANCATGSAAPLTGTAAPPLIKHCGLLPYEPTWRAMQRFTDQRDPSTPDEIWMVEHPPVFTLGLNGSREHLLAPGDIPVVQIDRGGQVTYHGPGQLVVYPLIDLRRHVLGVRQLVVALENAVIAYVAELGIAASGSRNAPGVYVGGLKLASIGLRIRRGASYHGMALNVSLDLEPFGRINVCGHRGLGVTRLSDLCGPGPAHRASSATGPFDGADGVASAHSGSLVDDARAHARAIDQEGAVAAESITVRSAAQGLTPHLLRELGFAYPVQRAINTDLQAVNSR